MHSVGYIKGAARTSTLLAVLHFAMVNDVTLKLSCPVLYESVLEIKAFWWHSPDAMQDAFVNMTMSVRGSIRTSPNVITVAMMIRNLNCDQASFVRKWNQQATVSTRITSKRASSLKLLFEQAPPDALSLILSHVEATWCQDLSPAPPSIERYQITLWQNHALVGPGCWLSAQPHQKFQKLHKRLPIIH